jgi:hypothetical protein
MWISFFPLSYRLYASNQMHPTYFCFVALCGFHALAEHLISKYLQYVITHVAASTGNCLHIAQLLYVHGADVTVNVWEMEVSRCSTSLSGCPHHDRRVTMTVAVSVRNCHVLNKATWQQLFLHLRPRTSCASSAVASPSTFTKPLSSLSFLIYCHVLIPSHGYR